MFWLIVGSIGVIFAKYYTAVGSRKLHRRINRVKLDLENSRRRLKEVRQKEYEMTNDEEHTIQRVRYMKEIIEDLRLRSTFDEEPPTAAVVESKAPAVMY